MSVVTIGGAVAAGEAYGAYKAGQKAEPAVEKAVSTVTQPVTAAVSAGLEWSRMTLTVLGWGLLGLFLVGAGIALLLSGRAEAVASTVAGFTSKEKVGKAEPDEVLRQALAAYRGSPRAGRNPDVAKAVDALHAQMLKNVDVTKAADALHAQMLK